MFALTHSFPKALVPNAPCGVESMVDFEYPFDELAVPNAPCGVESRVYTENSYALVKFLMHRVELKGFTSTVSSSPAKITCS